MSEIVKINQKIPLFFDEKDSNFLAETVTEEQINALEKELNKVTQSKQIKVSDSDVADYDKEVVKAQESVQRIKRTYETKKAINTLYKNDSETSAIKGSTVKKDLPIADDLKNDVFQKAKISYFKTGDIQPYDKTINELLTNVENQLTQIAKAKTALEKIYKDNKVISTDSGLYDTAKVETAKIKNEKIKKTFSDQLEKVKNEMSEKGNESTESTEQSINNESDQLNVPSNENLYQNSTDGGQGNNYGYNDYGNTPTGNNNGGTSVTPAPDNNHGNSNGGDDTGQTGNIDGEGSGETPPEEPNNGGNDTGNSSDQPTDSSD